MHGGKGCDGERKEENSRLGSREAKGTTKMLFSFEGMDAKRSIIRRRAQRPRRNLALVTFSPDVQ